MKIPLIAVLIIICVLIFVLAVVQELFQRIMPQKHKVFAIMSRDIREMSSLRILMNGTKEKLAYCGFDAHPDVSTPEMFHHEHAIGCDQSS